MRRAIVKPQKVVIKPPRGFRFHVRPPVLLALGFLVTILIGSLLLTLPFANQTGTVTPFITALFTATSAVCVTGLVVVDTGTYWSPFGQVVILLLIQLGGLGFMTSSTFLLILVGRRISLTERMLLGTSHGLTTLGGIVRLTRQIVVVTVLIELVGAVILALRFSQEFPINRGLWMGLFHAVSAFNNAGFDVVGDFRSLVPYNQDPIVVLAVVILLILGGISFTVLLNVGQHRAYRYLLLDTKLVLVITAALLAIGSMALLMMEFANPSTLGPLGLPLKVLNAFFMGATPRTAGFNTVDVAGLSDGSLLLTMALMLIGGAAGSTAGGIKVNTLGVLLAAVISSTKGRGSVTTLGRRIPTEDVGRALAVVLMALGLIFVVTLVLTLTESFSLTELAFEATSAFGTVGLTTGVTAGLSSPGQLLVAALMYVGRIGPLTLAFALSQRTRPEAHRYPEAHIRIG